MAENRTQTRGRMNEGQGSAENLYGQARDAARGVADSASELWDDVYDQGEEFYRQGSRAVGNVDMTGVLIGLVAGYALAWMIHAQQGSGDQGQHRRDHARPGSRDYRSGSGRGYR